MGDTDIFAGLAIQRNQRSRWKLLHEAWKAYIEEVTKNVGVARFWNRLPENIAEAGNLIVFM